VRRQGVRIAGVVIAAWSGQSIMSVDNSSALLTGSIDPSRAPVGKHVAWGYCHVPHGSTEDMTEAIESQVERFAPGFRDRILARHTMNTADYESYNPNVIGGDIAGGANTLLQVLARPFPKRDPYSTPNKRIYLASSSTPPGGGVHGMCGYWAALRVLR